MKKMYITPETSEFNIHLHQLLANSPTGSQVFDDYADEGATGLTKRDPGNIWGKSNFSDRDWSDSWE